MSPRLSISSVEMFKKCAKSYWFGHIQKVPSKTDYPRLLGVSVHRFIARLYVPSSHSLYYTDLASARGSWFWNWNDMLEKNRSRIKFPNKKKEREYAGLGWSCIAKYWDKNINKPRPIEVEKRYEMIIHGIYWLVGTIDQVRRISIEGIAKIRPELISEGQLIEGYAPVVIVDLKSGRGSWDLTDFVPEASPLEIAAHQFELHDNIQATAYWELYHKTHGKMPVGFYSYQLQSGKAFLTIRTENDYPTLQETLDNVISGTEQEKFPMNVGSHCKGCDYFEACVAVRGGHPLYVSKPNEGIADEGSRNVEIQHGIKVQKARQLRFRFTTPTLVLGNVSKKRGRKPKKQLKTPGIIMLPNFGEEQKERDEQEKEGDK